MIIYKNGGLSREDRISSKVPYPSVKPSDFAGGNRSYPIPTEDDAVDALRLAGLHDRPDIKTKVYKKFPSLRKASKKEFKKEGGELDKDKEIVIIMGPSHGRGICPYC